MVINLSQFWTWWRQLQHFGLNEDGSLSRIAFTKPDIQSRQWLADLWRQLGATVIVDGIGNVIAQKGQPPFVLVSSHTDSVPHGGHYDGVLGVLAGTLLLDQWTEKTRGLLVVDWSCEESSRFGLSTVGSRNACGESVLWSASDHQGVSLKDAAYDAFGGPSVGLWSLPRSHIQAALEFHMEQGDTLTHMHQPLAVVSAIAAPQRWQLTVKGEANHSGSTSMAERHDAIAAAALVVNTVENLSRELEIRGLRATITRWDAEPGAANVIAHTVHLLLDIRAQSEAVLEEFSNTLTRAIASLEQERQVSILINPYSREQPAALSGALSHTLDKVMANSGLPGLRVPSWPSHDSLVLARHVPTAMLFVRNISEVSHQGREYCSPDDVSLGLQTFIKGIEAICAEL